MNLLRSRVGRCLSRLAVAATVLSFLSSCTVVGSALVAASAVGVEYTIDNIAYKVFPEDPDRVREAVDRALARLTIRVERKWDRFGEKLVLSSLTQEHRVEIELEPVASNATRLRVDARWKKFQLLKDKALATAVIVETDRILYPTTASRSGG